MKVTIHTPRVYEEVWDITGLASASDAGIIEIVQGVRNVQGVKAVRTEARSIDAGTPFVYARGVEDFDAAARRWSETRDATERTQTEIWSYIMAELEAGRVSERRVSEALGIGRDTVRAWRERGEIGPGRGKSGR